MNTKRKKLTTDIPLSNQGAMAIYCRALLSAVLKYQGHNNRIQITDNKDIVTSDARAWLSDVTLRFLNFG